MARRQKNTPNTSTQETNAIARLYYPQGRWVEYDKPTLVKVTDTMVTFSPKRVRATQKYEEITVPMTDVKFLQGSVEDPKVPSFLAVEMPASQWGPVIKLADYEIYDNGMTCLVSVDGREMEISSELVSIIATGPAPTTSPKKRKAKPISVKKAPVVKDDVDEDDMDDADVDEDDMDDADVDDEDETPPPKKRRTPRKKRVAAARKKKVPVVEDDADADDDDEEVVEPVRRRRTPRKTRAVRKKRAAASVDGDGENEEVEDSPKKPRRRRRRPAAKRKATKAPRKQSPRSQEPDDGPEWQND